MAKPKPKKKPLTLEDFAVAIQKDLARMATKEDLERFATKEEIRGLRREISGLREEMASKEDIRKLREEMATKEDLDNVRDRIAVAKDQIQEQIAGLRYAKEIDEIRARVNVVEQKLGIKHTHRAA